MLSCSFWRGWTKIVAIVCRRTTRFTYLYFRNARPGNDSATSCLLYPVRAPLSFDCLLRCSKQYDRISKYAYLHIWPFAISVGSLDLRSRMVSFTTNHSMKYWEGRRRKWRWWTWTDSSIGRNAIALYRTNHSIARFYGTVQTKLLLDFCLSVQLQGLGVGTRWKCNWLAFLNIICTAKFPFIQWWKIREPVLILFSKRFIGFKTKGDYKRSYRSDCLCSWITVARENKKLCFMSFVEYLVAVKVFDIVEAWFIPVGHSQNDSDQRFSQASGRLHDHDGITLQDLYSELRHTNKGTANVCYLVPIANWSRLREL